MNQRRNFLRQAGLLSALSFVRPGLLLAKPVPLNVGLQLYTLREYIGKDVPGVLSKVAQAGYTDVETYGYSSQTHFWGLTPKAFKAALVAHGLTTSSGHYEMNGFLGKGNSDALKTYLEAATVCGQTYLVVPHLDERLRKTPDDFKAIAENMNKAGEMCKAAGLRLAYHNHDFEFKVVQGTTLYDVLLRETQPDLVDFELDLYWVVRGDLNPIKLIDAHPKRFTMWHVKDMDRTRPEHNTEIGAGSINFKQIFERAQASGLKHLFVEQEYFAMDAFQSIAQSAAYIRKKLLI